MRGSSFAGALFIVAVAASCAAIVGIDDLPPLPDAATGGSGAAGQGGGGATNGSGGGTCTDGVKNNGEAGIDCGGPCPTKCLGDTCTTGTECASSYCADGICCDGPCDAVCVTCTAAKKGTGVDGACGPVKGGTDPDDDCGSPTGDVCNGGAHGGSPACQCHDGVMDGGETMVDCGGVCAACGGTCTDMMLNNQESDVDCGGPNCGSTCKAGQTCANGSDCQSGLACYMSKCCQPDPMMTTCAGFNCGNVPNNCGQSVSCGTCPAAQVCVNNTCLDCNPGTTQTCQCTGKKTCGMTGTWGACVGGTDTNNDAANCGGCGICCPASCDPPGGRYVCSCGKCYDKNNCSCPKSDPCFAAICGC